MPHVATADCAEADASIGRPRAAACNLAAVDLTRATAKAQLEIPVLQRRRPRSSTTASSSSIIGQSGSGKSTLLHLLGTLDAPDAGEVRFDGQRIDNLPAAGRDLLRNQHFGMIFQFYHLLPELTTLENVLTPLMIAAGRVGLSGATPRSIVERATRAAGAGRPGHRLKHKPRELSGGEMQRAAIARALIAEPASAAGRRADRQPRSARPARKSWRFCEP